MPVAQPIDVMVVDDDPDVRETFEEALVDEGYSVVAAANGRDALELLRSYSPGVILLDLMMPIMNGREFRMAQIVDPSLADIPTVMMTAANRLDEQLAGLTFADVLRKPLGLEDLLGAVHAAVPGAARRR